ARVLILEVDALGADRDLAGPAGVGLALEGVELEVADHQPADVGPADGLRVHHVGDAQEVGHEHGLGRLVDLLGLADLLDPAVGRRSPNATLSWTFRWGKRA